MADLNPLDDLLHSETDESVVNALVASLESRLASPAHKEPFLSISNPSVNSNHVNNSSNNPTSTSSIFAQNTVVHLSNHTNDTGNFNNSNAKSSLKDNQLSELNLIHLNSPVTSFNSTVNSFRIASPNSLNSVNKSPSFQLITQQPSPATHSVISYSHINRATPPPNALPVNNINIENSSPVQNVQPNIVVSNALQTVVLQDTLNRSSPVSQMNAVEFVQNLQGIIRNSQGMVLNANSQPFSQKTNVHVVHSANGTSMITQPGSNPSVITVRGQIPSSQITLRPQVATPNVSNVASQGNNIRMQAANRMPSTPIRIASQLPNQINIAPRPGYTNTITLPAGLMPSQGAMLMKNEHGQIMLVQPRSLPQQHSVSAVTISTTPTQPKVQYVRQPNPGMSQRLPSGQILSLQPGAQPQTMMRQSIQSPVNTVHPQPVVRVTLPQNIQTLVRTTVPAGTGTVGHPQAAVTNLAAAAAQASAQQQQMLENVKKCKNFLSTLIKLASCQPEATVSNVRDLIQGLIDGKLEPEQFTENLQKELKSSPQPYLVPFLKKSLPLLRQSLLSNKMSIDGVKPPPPEIVQLPTCLTQVMHAVAPVQTMPKMVQGSQIISRVVQGTQVHQKVTLSHMPDKPVPNKPVNMVTARNVPSTVKALHNRVVGLVQSSSLGPTHLHKTRVKESFNGPVNLGTDPRKEDDDDINDVATMGGVNLSEESKNILATNAEFIGTQIRSCKDETFLLQGPLINRMLAIARKHGISEVPVDVVSLISHATQERLRHIVEKLSTLAEQRTEVYKVSEQFEQSHDVRTQLKFLEELDILERKRHDDQEKEVLRRAAKSRSKHEDPEQLKLKQRAKDLHQAEMEEVRQREANLTALAAIGPRKRRKLEESPVSSGTTPLPKDPSSSHSKTHAETSEVMSSELELHSQIVSDIGGSSTM